MVEVTHYAPLTFIPAIAYFVVAFLVAVAARSRPALGIAALLVLDPFDYTHTFGPTTITLFKAALVGFVLALCSRRTSVAALRAPQVRALVGGALALIAVTALTAIPAVYIDSVLRETLKAAEYFAAFAVTAVAFSEEPDEPALWGSVLLATASVCALSLLQEFTQAPAGYYVNGIVIPRIAGPLEGPNQLAGYLDLTIPLLLARTLDLHSRGRNAVWTALLTACAILTDLLTFSRAGLLGAVVGVLLVVFLFRNRTIRLSLPLTAALATGFAAVLVALERFGALARFFSVDQVTQDNGLATRTALWEAAVKLWQTDPGLGVGAGNYELLVPTVGLIGVRTHANSLYLQSLAEGGVLLFSATVWTLVAALRTTFAAARRSAFGVGLAAGTAALAIHQIFDFLTFFTKVGSLWWVLLGIAAGIVTTDRRLDDEFV